MGTEQALCPEPDEAAMAREYAAMRDAMCPEDDER